MPSKNRSKFNVDNSSSGKEQRTYKGITYASKMEMEYYRDWIEPRVNSGEIADVKMQVKYLLQPAFEHNGKKFKEMNYISDFDLYFSDGTFRVVDVKGMLKNEDKIKEKLFRYRYPEIDFIFIGKSLIDGGWVDIDIINKGRKERKKQKNKQLQTA